MWVEQESQGAGEEKRPLILPSEEEVLGLLPIPRGVGGGLMGSCLRLRSGPHWWFSNGSEMEKNMAAEWPSMWVETGPCQPLEPREPGQPRVGVQRVLQKLGV